MSDERSRRKLINTQLTTTHNNALNTTTICNQIAHMSNVVTHINPVTLPLSLPLTTVTVPLSFDNDVTNDIKTPSITQKSSSSSNYAKRNRKKRKRRGKK